MRNGVCRREPCASWSSPPPSAARCVVRCCARVNVSCVDLNAVELRVLGCLIEKQRTTPDQYPLSLNGLRLASNQATNRDPVVEYDEGTVRAALDRLGKIGRASCRERGESGGGGV